MQGDFVGSLGRRASFAAVVIAILVAVFEVQGWGLPLVLALVLVGTLITMAIVALVSVGADIVRAGIIWSEARVTTTTWIVEEPPGRFDYIPDGAIAAKRFRVELKKFTRDTTKLGRKLNRHTATAKKHNNSDAVTKRRIADAASPDISNSASYIEKRAALFTQTVGEIRRNYYGMVEIVDLADPDERESAGALASALLAVAEETKGAIVQAHSYRDAVRSIEQQNITRRLRVSSHRLANGLDEVIRVLEAFVDSAQEIAQGLQERLQEAGDRAK